MPPKLSPFVGVSAPMMLANLFHVAAHVCLKFRGRKPTGKEADRVVKTALANFVVNSDPDGIDRNLRQRPLLAFVLCYVSAQLALDLLDEQQAEKILICCDEKLDEE